MLEERLTDELNGSCDPAFEYIHKIPLRMRNERNGARTRPALRIVCHVCCRRSDLHAQQQRQQIRAAGGLRRGEKRNGDHRVPRASEPRADRVPLVVQQHDLVDSHRRRGRVGIHRIADQTAIQRHRQHGRWFVFEFVESVDVRTAHGFRLRHGRVLGSEPRGSTDASVRLSRDRGR